MESKHGVRENANPNLSASPSKFEGSNPLRVRSRSTEATEAKQGDEKPVQSPTKRVRQTESNHPKDGKKSRKSAADSSDDDEPLSYGVIYDQACQGGSESFVDDLEHLSSLNHRGLNWTSNDTLTSTHSHDSFPRTSSSKDEGEKKGQEDSLVRASFVLKASQAQTTSERCVVRRKRSTLKNMLYPTYELYDDQGTLLIIAKKQSSSSIHFFDMTRGTVGKPSKKSGRFLQTK